MGNINKGRSNKPIFLQVSMDGKKVLNIFNSTGNINDYFSDKYGVKNVGSNVSAMLGNHRPDMNSVQGFLWTKVYPKAELNIAEIEREGLENVKKFQVYYQLMKIKERLRELPFDNQKELFNDLEMIINKHKI